jgi:hypothetical protein
MVAVKFEAAGSKGWGCGIFWLLLKSVHRQRDFSVSSRNSKLFAMERFTPKPSSIEIALQFFGADENMVFAPQYRAQAVLQAKLLLSATELSRSGASVAMPAGSPSAMDEQVVLRASSDSKFGSAHVCLSILRALKRLRSE